ncbi:MAG TPA: S1 RNA-binding domain-containing protein, partial [Caldilineaceae bacterium]|nr:S1 RNA-binding domain-containing protein [Caldilineaceae bacterium]
TKTIRELEKGELVNGTVTRILPYGAFVDIGIGRDALLHIREMSEGYVARPEDVVSVGEELEARIIELSRRRQRVDLSIKGLRPEPEAAVMPEEEAQSAEPEASEEEVVDEFADVEVLSPMELAFKRAMEAEGIEIKGTGKKSKRRRGKQGRSIQDEIIARTLGVVSED